MCSFFLALSLLILAASSVVGFSPLHSGPKCVLGGCSTHPKYSQRVRIGERLTFTPRHESPAVSMLSSSSTTKLYSSALERPDQPEFVNVAVEVFVTALRLGTCALMVHHGIDKIQHVDGFSANVVAKFFGFLPGPPAFWTLSAAATQIVGAALLAVGVVSRPVALSMTATMVTAVAFHLMNTGQEGFPLGVPDAHSYNFELASMYVLVLSYFSVAGAGKFSVDEQILGGELNFYSRQLDKVFGKGGEEE